MHLPCKPRSAGFTLFELVMVIVIVGIVGAFAAMKSYSPAEMSLPSQAQKMASDIDSAKTLAYTLGTRVRFTSSSTSYTYGTCVTASPRVCPPSCTDIVVLPLQQGVTLAVSPGTSTPLYFSSLGQPFNNACNPLSSATSYTMTFGASTETISVAALTGLVTVSP